MKKILVAFYSLFMVTSTAYSAGSTIKLEPLYQRSGQDINKSKSNGNSN